MNEKCIRFDEKNFTSALSTLFSTAAASLPSDVERKLREALKAEESQTARNVLATILENVSLARKEETPICQDTGTPIFFVEFDSRIATQLQIKHAIIQATNTATKQIPLRPNAVDTLAGKNTGANIPIIYFDESECRAIEVSLLLKGGGSENVGVGYKLPSAELNAQRDLAGVEKCVLDAVLKAQGKGCAPGILGVCIGGTKDSASVEAKKQLLRKLNDSNKNKKLNELEQALELKLNQLGIGPMGLGGKTTVLGVKIGVLPRHPASFFVEIAYNCWCARRKKMVWKNNNAKFE